MCSKTFGGGEGERLWDAKCGLMLCNGCLAELCDN